MIGTANCVYETPCGWCSKWDKKCDQKVPEYEQRAKTESIYDFIDTGTGNATCQHEWESISISTVGTTYICRKCGMHKKIPLANFNPTTTITTSNNDF